MNKIMKKFLRLWRRITGLHKRYDQILLLFVNGELLRKDNRPFIEQVEYWIEKHIKIKDNEL